MAKNKSDLMVMNTGSWGAYYVGLDIYRDFKDKLSSMGVKSMDGYNEILLVHLESSDGEIDTERKIMVADFIKSVYDEYKRSA